MTREYSDTKGPLIKALVLFGALILVFVLKGFLPQFGSKAMQVFNFTEEDKAAVRKEVAGFWMADYKTTFGSVQERLEIVDNGYFFWYTNTRITLPNDSVYSYIVMKQDFLDPHSQKENSPYYTCDLAKINLTYLFDDTCNVKMKNLDERYYLAEIQRISKDSLYLNGRNYTLYTDSIQRFFPIDLIKSLGNHNVLTCTMKEKEDLQVKEALAQSIKEIAYSKELQEKLFSDYYFPLILQKMDIHFLSGEGSEISFTITIEADGSVSYVQLSGEPVKSPSVRNAIKDEILTWKFLKGTSVNKVSLKRILK